MADSRPFWQQSLRLNAGIAERMKPAGSNALQTVSFVWGILALIGVLAAIAPFFGALNWVLIPFAVIGVLVSAVALGMASPGHRGKSTAGLICCGLAAIVGLIRLVLGLGVV